MTPANLRFAAPAAGAALGVAYGPSALGLSASVLLVWFWSLARTRLLAYLTAFCFYALAARELPAAVRSFSLVDHGLSLPFVVGCCAVLSLPWALFWSADLRHLATAWRPAALLALLAVPPFAAIAVCHPLTVGGFLLPRAGWCGLALLFAAVSLSPSSPFARRSLVVLLLILAAFGTPRATPSAGWHAPATHIDPAPVTDFVAQYRSSQAVLLDLESHRGVNAAYGEGLAGLWGGSMTELWLPAFSSDAIRVVGAVRDTGPAGLENGAVVGAAHQHHFVPQRVPVPFAMWRPLGAPGYAPSLLSTGTADVAGARVAVLVCYEQFLLWPAALSFSQDPDLLVVLSNLRWVRGTHAGEVQFLLSSSWARLFDVPLVAAINT